MSGTNKILPPSPARIFGKSPRRKTEKADVDELSNILLQVSLAVMLVFMIAVFLFIDKTGGELNQLENLKEELSQFKREKIDNALETMTKKYRVVYGIAPFLWIDPHSGKKSFRCPLPGGNDLSAEAFRTGSCRAWQDFQQEEKLHEKWMTELSGLLGTIDPALRAYAFSGAKKECDTLRKELLELQRLAAADIQKGFADHPEKIEDETLFRLLQQSEKAKTGEERRLFSRAVNQKLQSLVLKQLEKECGAPMLEDK